MKIEIVGSFDETGEVDFKFTPESAVEKALLVSLHEAKVTAFDPKANNEPFIVRFLGRDAGRRKAH